jgi:hypothetical protein
MPEPITERWDDDAPTDLDKYLRLREVDDNVYWRISSGHGLNIIDELIERNENLTRALSGHALNHIDELTERNEKLTRALMERNEDLINSVRLSTTKGVVAKLEERLSRLQHKVLPRSMEFTVPHNAQVTLLKEILAEFKEFEKQAESYQSQVSYQKISDVRKRIEGLTAYQWVDEDKTWIAEIREYRFGEFYKIKDVYSAIDEKENKENV